MRKGPFASPRWYLSDDYPMAFSRELVLAPSGPIWTWVWTSPLGATLGGQVEVPS